MRIAVHQCCTGIDPERNARDLVAAIARARGEGAAILFTPEMSGLLDRDRKRSAGKLFVEADDPVLAAVRAAAREHRLWVHLGSLAVRVEGDNRLANRSLLIDDEGVVRARYDKIHLFDVDLPSGESWRESAAYAAGSEPVVAPLPQDGRLGMSVCYDIRFPDLYRALTDAGATVLAVPAAFTVPTGRAHWHVLLRARAIEAGAFVVAAAQAGTHEDGRTTYGHSLVVDPWGEVLLDMGEEPGLAIVDLDPARVAEVRGRIPAIEHRRSIGAPRVLA